MATKKVWKNPIILTAPTIDKSSEWSRKRSLSYEEVSCTQPTLHDLIRIRSLFNPLWRKQYFCLLIFLLFS